MNLHLSLLSMKEAGEVNVLYEVMDEKKAGKWKNDFWIGSECGSANIKQEKHLKKAATLRERCAQDVEYDFY